MHPSEHEWYVVTPPGLESITREELAALGQAPVAMEPGGLTLRGGLDAIYAANLHLRTASRILVRAAGFHASTFYELERRAKRVPWAAFVSPGSAVEFRVTSRKSKLYHRRAVAERLATAVRHAVPDVRVASGGEDDGAPDVQRFVVRLLHDECTVSADSSGEHLHRRGYRLATAKAPLRETLAAAALMAARWDPAAPLLDPMCGSGTIPIEAAWLARRVAPGLGRRFAFERWPGFEAGRWAQLVAEARERIVLRVPAPILASDRDSGAIEAATANAERAGVAGDIEFRRAAISAIAPPARAGWVVSNPPYGVRVGAQRDLRNLFAQLGNVLRRRCPGWHVALLSAERELERQVGLAFATGFETNNGGIRVRLVTAAVPGGPPHRDAGRATDSRPSPSAPGSPGAPSSP